MDNQTLDTEGADETGRDAPAEANIRAITKARKRAPVGSKASHGRRLRESVEHFANELANSIPAQEITNEPLTFERSTINGKRFEVTVRQVPKKLPREAFIRLLAEDRVGQVFRLFAEKPDGDAVPEQWHRARFLLDACEDDTQIECVFDEGNTLVRFAPDQEEVRFQLWKPHH